MSVNISRTLVLRKKIFNFTLYMTVHSSDVLQPLDEARFSLLKGKHSERVRSLARRHAFHMNKEGFLSAFRHALFDVFTEQNCRKAFRLSSGRPVQ
jgi:hypothetical protein